MENDYTVEQATAAPGEKRELLREVRRYREGEYVEVWETEPPPLGVKYRVIDDEWTEDYTERRIRAIELLD